MARRNDHEPVQAGRTRTSATMVAVTLAVILLVLLVIFIGQNNRSVPVYFLGANGHVSEAVALVASALAGAVLVLAVGIARITQLRIRGRRHNRQMARQAADDEAPRSTPAPPEREP